MQEARIDAGPFEPPTSIGGYRILELLGEGGMGTVYLAEQREPIHRRVAIKVIKLGMHCKSDAPDELQPDGAGLAPQGAVGVSARAGRRLNDG